MKDIALLIREYNKAWQGSNAIYENWAKKKGFSYTAFLIITSLSDEERCTQNSISTTWQIPKQSINSILSVFVKEGLVKFEVDNNDRRAKIIKLTEKGKERFLPIIEELHSLELKAASTFGKEKLTMLLEYTKELNIEIEKEMKE